MCTGIRLTASGTVAFARTLPFSANCVKDRQNPKLGICTNSKCPVSRNNINFFFKLFAKNGI